MGNSGSNGAYGGSAMFFLRFAYHAIKEKLFSHLLLIFAFLLRVSLRSMWPGTLLNLQ